MSETDAAGLIQPTVDALNQAWKRADAAGFAARFTEDAEFVNLLGMHVRGRPAIAAIHEKIYAGPYKDSVVHFTILRTRVLSGDAIFALLPAELDVPAGPVKGLLKTIASVLFVRVGDEWQVASFQNTKVEAVQANFTTIMSQVFET